uniref:Anti-sigma-28 factor FlgM C-terminal domain-containing protein n=1 Tax=Eiseniibacteriota bacterium TaxID=2212470 RepID=A0A832HZB1_UNCEI
MTAAPAAGPRPPALTLVGATPPGEDVRWDRVRNARARIAAGWYERPEVLAALADAVLEEFERD